MSLLRPITEIGQGYSTFRGEAVDTAITGEIQNGGTAETKVKISICTTAEEILHALSIDASVEANCSWGSFSDRFEYTMNTSRKTNTVTILCVATRTTGSQTIHQAKLKQKHKHANDLYDQGGDCFVSSLSFGAQYIASYQYTGTTTEQFESIKNTANASAGDGETNVKASLTTAVSNVHNTTGVMAEFTSDLIGVEGVNLPDQNGVADFALSLGTLNVNKPEILNFSVSSYREVTGHPKDVQAMDDNRKHFYDPADPSAGLGGMRVALLDALTAVAGTKDLYDFYHCVAAEPHFDEKATTYKDQVAQIKKWADTVDADPTTKKAQLPQIKAADITKPVPVFDVLSGPWAGGHGGGSFNNTLSQNGVEVPLLTRIAWIAFHGNRALDAITVGYESKLPQLRTWDSGRHGGDGGDDYGRITLNPDEVVKQIDVRWSHDDQVCKVFTITTDKQSKTAPNPVEGDETDTWTFQEGKTCFYDLVGNSGGLVNAVQVRYLQFGAAKWVAATGGLKGLRAPPKAAGGGVANGEAGADAKGGATEEGGANAVVDGDGAGDEPRSGHGYGG